MKRCIHHISITGLALGLIAGAHVLPARAEPAKAPASAAAATAGSATAAGEADNPRSVFTLPSSPKEGRNPFFPQSTAAVPANPKPTEADFGAAAFVLNGITSPPKRTAMINGRPFETGEESEIKLPSGSKILVKCVEIRDDSAVILVAGQRRELRLRFGI
jgi:hypothetical protein